MDVMRSILLLTTLVLPAAANEPKVDYLKQIKPILAEKCYACHGTLRQQAGLRLETQALMLNGGDSGPAIVPGNAKESLLLQRILAKLDERMPPKAQGSPLTKEQIRLVRLWINQGAKSPKEATPTAISKHWSYQPIKRPAVRRVKSTWTRNPIDSFIAAQHLKRGLTPQPEAGRLIQLRRLYVDLVGVPPTSKEIDAARIKQAGWYSRTVELLLKDPRHGQRWGRHWMDIWRYSDWWGLGGQLRNSQKHIYHWRDWIVDSLNKDLPYDEMVRLMLAADESHPNDLSRLRATGFLARNYFLFNRQQWLEETVEHVSKGFLAITMNCAKCHDHKFDPISQKDFYRLRAFFEPYHVRMDVVPGQPDLAVNGIPRVFDARPETPTYVFIRGNEKAPDRSQIIKPGVPDLLAFSKLQIKPIKLPLSAWQPERRSWVVKGHEKLALQSLKRAQAKHKRALAKLALVKDKTAPLSGVIVEDDFKKLDKSRWELFGGDWHHESGDLVQKRDGKTRSVLRFKGHVPRDFDATVEFTILGGNTYRSFGIGFDGYDGDPTKTLADYREQNVYVSAARGAGKIQASYHRGNRSFFPGPPAAKYLPIAIKRKHTLRVRVRGTLINAYLNGRLMIAWRTPAKRLDGRLLILAYDCVARIHRVQVRALSKTAKLVQAKQSPKPKADPVTTVAGARRALEVAAAEIRAAKAKLDVVRKVMVAIRAKSADRDRLTIAALEADRSYAVAAAELESLQARDKPERARRVASTKLRFARKLARQKPKMTDRFRSFTGAQWTPTRFAKSTRDDPTPKFHPTSTGRRSALAKWITDRRNPLTARVAANHIWARHMGQPLVASVYDFGPHGSTPTHPKLLDWLASELIDNNWSMKHLHRLIVSSATYRMSSSKLAATQAIAATRRKSDQDNKYWWRRVPLRLESQAVRDSVLALAGDLDYKMGGPAIPRGEQPMSKRRSLYFNHSDIDRNLFLSTFDEALVKECYRRQHSIVPQQALALANSRLVLDGAKKVAARLSQQYIKERDFIRAAFRLVLSIEVSERETAASEAALRKWRQLPNIDEPKARANLIWALLNHNDFVTLR